jgi:hypothetical protein
MAAVNEEIKPFGQEDMTHINIAIMVDILNSPNPTAKLQEIIFEKSCNINARPYTDNGNTNMYLVYTKNNMFELITLKELAAAMSFYRLLYIKTMFREMQALIHMYGPNFLNSINQNLEAIKLNYLESRSGILKDKELFSDEEIRNYKGKEMKNLKLLIGVNKIVKKHHENPQQNPLFGTFDMKDNLDNPDDVIIKKL